MTNIKKQIKDRQKETGKTVYRVSVESGHSQQLIGEWLKDKRDPRFSTVQDIVKSLGGTLTIIWDDKTTIPPKSKRK